MDSRTAIGLRVGFLGALAIIGVGCPNPNTYTTPRTVGSGRISHSIAAETWGYSTPTSTTGGTLVTGTATFPTLPTYTLRIGVGDSVEIGGRIANMTSLGADVKWNFVRTGLFDVAIDPAAQIFEIGTSTNGASSQVSVVYLHAPLLLGLNLSRAVSLVLAPGVTYGIVSATVSTSSSRDSASATSGPMGRLGFGIDLRLSPTFALHPEITFLRTFDSSPTTLYLFGLGFNFGGLPSFDDVGGGASPAPAAPPPAGYPPPPASYPPPAAPPPS